MSLIIRQIFFALTLISIIYECQCRNDGSKVRLSKVFEEIVEASGKHSKKELKNEIFRALNMDCVKNFLHLPQNNKTIVNLIEVAVFVNAALIKCSDEDKVFEDEFDDYIHENLERILSCARWHLQQLEPTSKLVENFVISKAELEECKTIFLNDELSEVQQRLEYLVGPLEVFTCGAVSANGANDYLKFLAKGAVIKFGDISDELKKSEKEKLKILYKNVSATTTNCIFKRFEDEPEAYLANNSLNYYYKEISKPIIVDEKNPNYYYKRLNKVEEVIDKDCTKERLDLPKHGNKAVLEIEARLLIASAKSKCIKVNLLEFADLFIDFALDGPMWADTYFPCIKKRLRTLEPTSKLAIASIDETIDDDCRDSSTFLQTFSMNRYSYVDHVGRLNETTCGVFTDHIVEVITSKTALLGYEKDKDLKISEIKDLFEYATDKLHKLADCIIERIK